MIDWNNNGKVDGEDWMLTEIILEDEERPETRRRGGCLTSIALFVALGVFWGIQAMLLGKRFL